MIVRLWRTRFPGAFFCAVPDRAAKSAGPFDAKAPEMMENPYNSVTNVCKFTYIWYIYYVYLLPEYYLL